MHTDTYMCPHTDTHTHTRMQARTHTHTHTHTYMYECGFRKYLNLESSLWVCSILRRAALGRVAQIGVDSIGTDLQDSRFGCYLGVHLFWYFGILLRESI